MKAKKLVFYTLCAGIGFATFTRCDEDEDYGVDAPYWLQEKIDAIAAQKSLDAGGDTTYIEFAALSVGQKDCSSAWWTEFSDYFEVPAGKLCHLEFTNYSSGASNWNNWNLAAANKKRDTDGYGEYFVIRSDNYGWGGTLENGYDAALLSVDYAEVQGLSDIDWAGWLSVMNGAKVTMEIDHSIMGPTYVTVSQLCSDGKTYTETFVSEGTTTDPITTWLICDNSYFEMKSGYFIPSERTVIEDQLPIKIEVSGAPKSIELGETDFWKDAIATITFADGTTAVADTANITFDVVPDVSTVGQKTVLVSYSKTKQGNYGPAVATYYTFEVSNPILSIEATASTIYYFKGSSKLLLNNANNVVTVTATYGDNTTGILSPDNYTISLADSSLAIADEFVINISYKTSKGEILKAQAIAKTAEFTQKAYTHEPVGAADFTNEWWSTFSQDWVIASGEAATWKISVTSDNGGNWHSPCYILRKANMTEYAVTRSDNYGWGDVNYGTIIAECDWNWDTFASSINGSEYVVTVSNNGDNTADIYVNVVDGNGVQHFQNYRNVTIDSSDFQFAFVTEESYLVFHE